jgi:hypothetical protein
MRGEPGDAMARMKRWEAVRQRLADANGHSAQTVDQVVQAVSEVVRDHEDLTVTVTVDDGGELSTVRIVQRAGRLDVTRLQPQPLATPAPPGRLATPVHPSGLATAGPPSRPATPASTPPAPPPPSDPRWHGDSPWAGQTLRPDWQGRDPETLDQTAARLAELIRQDPSLLDGNGLDGNGLDRNGLDGNG